VVYAGLRDPMWKIGQCLYSDIPNLLHQAKSSGHVYQHECIPPKTGYKGFLIQDTTDELSITGPETIQLQLLLLDTMPDELPPTGSYRQRIRNVITSGKVSADCPNTAGNESCVLPKSLDRWNAIEEIRRKNNGTTMSTALSQIHMHSLEEELAKFTLRSLQKQLKMLQNVMVLSL